MGRLRLRTKFLIAMLLTSAGLTAVSLLIVQRTVENQVRRELGSDLANSVETFRNVQREREAALARSAELMADLPSLKALMTSRHAPTIQDASGEMFRLSGGDLFALIDPANQFVGFHTKAPGITREQAQRLLQHRNALDEPLQWWFADGHLYEVVLKPIYFGRPADNSLLGMVAVGDEMNAAVAREVGQIAASQVAIVCGQDVVVSTLNSEQTNELRAHLSCAGNSARADRLEAGEGKLHRFLAGARPGSVAGRQHRGDEVLRRGHRLSESPEPAASGGWLRRSLCWKRAGLFHRQDLYASTGKTGGWRAGVGERRLSLSSTRTVDAGEVAELTNAFGSMRESLHQTQQRLLNAERLATIGTMASSISHDLRHPLTAVLANAEFLADADLSPQQREELYLEIRVAVNRLTDLIDSLLELSRPAESLSAAEAPIERTISRAIELVQAHPQFQKINVAIESAGVHNAQFDARKMERVFYNLLLNACQAAQGYGGHVAVTVANHARHPGDSHLLTTVPAWNPLSVTNYSSHLSATARKTGRGLG